MFVSQINFYSVFTAPLCHLLTNGGIPFLPLPSSWPLNNNHCINHPNIRTYFETNTFIKRQALKQKRCSKMWISLLQFLTFLWINEVKKNNKKKLILNRWRWKLRAIQLIHQPNISVYTPIPTIFATPSVNTTAILPCTFSFENVFFLNDNHLFDHKTFLNITIITRIK